MASDSLSCFIIRILYIAAGVGGSVSCPKDTLACVHEDRSSNHQPLILYQLSCSQHGLRRFQAKVKGNMRAAGIKLLVHFVLVRWISSSAQKREKPRNLRAAVSCWQMWNSATAKLFFGGRACWPMRHVSMALLTFGDGSRGAQSTTEQCREGLSNIIIYHHLQQIITVLTLPFCLESNGSFFKVLKSPGEIFWKYFLCESCCCSIQILM